MPVSTRRLIAFALVLTTLPCIAAVEAQADDWGDIRRASFDDRAVADAAPGTVTLYGPSQAADGALVPISIHLSTATALRAKSLTIVIDRNPVPLAAAFHFGDAFRVKEEVGDRIIATRIRIDSFSKVRVVLETDDGVLHMIAKFIAGAGGCSALPSKDAEQALAQLGRVKVKENGAPAREPAWRFTGMQMNPQTGTYTPARYVETLEIKRGDALLVRMSGGISISEDPNLRITYAATTNERLTVTGRDTEGTKFQSQSDGAGS